MRLSLSHLSLFVCIVSLSAVSFSQDPNQGTEPVSTGKQMLSAQTRPPEMAMLTSIDENLQGRYSMVYWEGQMKDGKVVWNSKTVEKQANLEFVVFHVVGGKKGIKGVSAIEALRKKLPVPILLTNNGKDLDPYYEAFYRTGVVVMTFPSNR